MLKERYTACSAPVCERFQCNILPRICFSSDIKDEIERDNLRKAFLVVFQLTGVAGGVGIPNKE